MPGLPHMSARKAAFLHLHAAVQPDDEEVTGPFFTGLHVVLRYPIVGRTLHRSL